MKRSRVFSLPRSVRDALIARAATTGLADYRGLHRWLARRGFSISSSSLHRSLSPFAAELHLLRRAQFVRLVSRGARVSMSTAIMAVVLGDLARARSARLTSSARRSR